MFNDNTRLSAKVRAVNKANAYAKELYSKLAPIFAPFVGLQIEKQDGDLLAKVKKLVPELPCTPSIRVCRHRSDYSLAYTIYASESHEIGSVSHEVHVYLGQMRAGVLIEMIQWNELRTDYTADEVNTNRQAYKEAQKIADEAKSALHPFGEYDR